MKKHGDVGGPFELFIGIIVFAMALVIGGYLFEMVNCWKCNELLKSEATDFREAIASVGKGDTNSKRNMIIEVEDLGSCATGIFLRHVMADGTLECRNMCPDHPNSCWVIISESSCGGGDTEIDCIDIGGDMDIVSTHPDLGKITTSNNQWLDNAWAITHTISVKIEKTEQGIITISPPG